MIKYLTFCLLSLILISCASNPRIEDLSSEQRAKLSKIEIYEGGVKRSHKVIKTISGLSCNRNKYQEQDISEEEALEGLQIKAVQLNADAVINTYCQTNSDTDWRNNCWASIKCVGDAIVYQ